MGVKTRLARFLPLGDYGAVEQQRPVSGCSTCHDWPISDSGAIHGFFHLTRLIAFRSITAEMTAPHMVLYRFMLCLGDYGRRPGQSTKSTETESGSELERSMEYGK